MIKIMSSAAIDSRNSVATVKCSTWHNFDFRRRLIYCRKIKLR